MLVRNKSLSRMEEAWLGKTKQHVKHANASRGLPRKITT